MKMRLRSDASARVARAWVQSSESLLLLLLAGSLQTSNAHSCASGTQQRVAIAIDETALTHRCIQEGSSHPPLPLSTRVPFAAPIAARTHARPTHRRMHAPHVLAWTPTRPHARPHAHALIARPSLPSMLPAAVRRPHGCTTAATSTTAIKPSQAK